MSQDPTITIKEAPEPRGPYVHARQHGGLVYVTAQIGRDPKTGDFVTGASKLSSTRRSTTRGDPQSCRLVTRPSRQKRRSSSSRKATSMP